MSHRIRQFALTLAVVLAVLLAGESRAETEETPPRSPEETARSFVLPPGFSATVFAGEPDVVQPIGMAVDGRGRVWVAESLSHPHWAETGRDRITIFEDADGDGRHDRRTVFYDKLNYVSGVEIGFGGVWVVSAPNLLFIPDRDGDDVPDGPPKVLLDGFGHQGIHNLVNGFTWGPDGWLYAGHGGTSFGMIGKPGTAEAQRVFFDGGIWRYHPVRHEFEVVLRGTTNPWGIDFDEFGEAFFTNSVTPHLYHMIPGGHVQRRVPSKSSRHAYDVLGPVADHLHWVGGHWEGSRGGKPEQVAVGGGHAHSGCMIYSGDAWPREYRGKIFMVNIHGDRVNVDVPRRAGSGYAASHGSDFLVSRDPWFQGLQLRQAPDGNVYLSDWYDTGECHTRKPDTKSGRIYKICYGKAGEPRHDDVSKLDDADVGALQDHRNEWFVRHGRRVLQERAAAGGLKSELVTPSLAITLERGATVQERLRALWALNAIGWFAPDVDDEDTLSGLLAAPEPLLRAWAIRLAAEDRHVNELTWEAFRQLASSDPSPVVRLHLASASMRLPDEQRWPIVEALAARDDDANDPNLPLMVWYTLEPLVTKNPDRAIRAAEHSKLPRLREFVARRIVAGEQ